MNNTMNRFLGILCYPFCSLDFFFDDYFEKYIDTDKSNASKLYVIEKELNEKLISYIGIRQNIYSYDEVYLYLKYTHLSRIDYFKEGYKGKRCSVSYYLDYLKEMSESLVSLRDGRIVFKYWKNEYDKEIFGEFGEKNKIFLFHSLNTQMPIDIIIMSYVVNNMKSGLECLYGYYGQLEISDQQLEKVLNYGVAENHMHRGAASSFSDNWESLMSMDPHMKIKEIYDSKEIFKNNEVSDDEMFFLVMYAALARFVIALLVRYKKYIFYDNIICKDVYGISLEEMMCMFADGNKLHEYFIKLKNKNIITYFEDIWEQIRKSISHADCDGSYLKSIFGISDDYAQSEENIFLYNTLNFLYESNTDEKKWNFVGRLFIQYIRIKNCMFYCNVQQKNIRGLDNFQKRYYRRNSDFTTIADQMNERSWLRSWKNIIRRQFNDVHLEKVEFRTSISNKESDLREDVRNFLCAYRDVIYESYCKNENGKYIVKRSFPKVGLVFHLIKSVDNIETGKCFMEADSNNARLYFGGLSEKYEEQVRMLIKFRDEIKGLDRYIVGLDAASLENATPTWVFTSAYENARDAKIEKIGYTYENRAQSMRFTFHAGEDFRHMLSGIRRVDEVVEFLKFHAGDRIGHGTVLGIDAMGWLKYNPIVVLPRIEALENYLWLYALLIKEKAEADISLMKYIEQKISVLSKEIYGENSNISTDTLVCGYLKMFSFNKSDMNRLCSCKEDDNQDRECEINSCIYGKRQWNADVLVCSRHCNRFRLKIDKPITCEVTEQDIRIIKLAQQIIKKKLSRKGIVVEINPSSNIAIGEIDKITDSQIYKLNKPGESDNVIVCVNSDDPSVFNTNVTNELAYIYYGMLYEGYSREESLKWVDTIRKSGMDASFIQQSEDCNLVLEELEEIIRAI